MRFADTDMGLKRGLTWGVVGANSGHGCITDGCITDGGITDGGITDGGITKSRDVRFADNDVGLKGLVGANSGHGRITDGPALRPTPQTA